MGLNANALVTWDFTKQMLELDTDDQSAAEFFINAVSQQAERIAHRHLMSAAYTLVLDGNGRASLVLPDFPVVSTTSLKIDTARAFGATTLVAATDYRVDADTGIIKLYTQTFPLDVDCVQYVGSLGYATIPSDLQEAALIVVSANLKRFRGSQIGIRSVTSPDGVNTAFELDIPMSAMSIFASYKDAR